MAEQLWRVVGGGDKGGIVARIGCGLQSAQLEPRLSTGSLIRQLSLYQGRLNYELVKGTGPDEGWVSLKLKDNDLVVKSDGSDAEVKPPPKAEVKPTPKVEEAKEAAGVGAAGPSKLPVWPEKLARDKEVGMEDFVAKLGALEKILESADNDSILRALDDLKTIILTVPEEVAMRYIQMWSRFNVLLMAKVREGRSKVAPTQVWQSHGIFQSSMGTDGMGMYICQPSEAFDGQVFFCLGWGGSTLPDMKDVGDFYCTKYPSALVVVVIASTDATSMASLADTLVAAINAWADKPDVTPSLVIHMFSNMGMMAWSGLLPMWAAQVVSPDESRLRGKVPPMEKVLKALILDSSPDEFIPYEPAVNSVVNGAAATYSILLGLNTDGTEMDKKQLMKSSMEAKMEAMHAHCPIRKYFESQQDELFKFTRPQIAPVREYEPAVPMLFIYSTVDKIIPWQGVEKYLAEMETRMSKLGVPAPRTLKFEDRQSAHCFHKKVHPEEYWKAVSGLLTDVL